MPSAAEIDLSSLPEDQRAVLADVLREHAELLPANAALTAEATDLKQIVQRLEHLVAELNHVLHGKKSEKLGEDDRQLAFEDLESALAEAEAERDDRAASSEAPRRKVTPAQRNRGHLPAGLPRIERIVEPDSLECPCGCGQMHRIGEDRAERLDIVPAQLCVLAIVRPKYACRVCTDGVTQARAPAALVEGGCRPRAPSPTCWSANTPAICPCSARAGSLPGRASTSIAARWPTGSAWPRSTSARSSTGWPSV